MKSSFKFYAAFLITAGLLLPTVYSQNNAGGAPSEAQLVAQIKELQGKVNLLPGQAAAGEVKAMLQVALECAQAATEASSQDVAQSLIADVSAALVKSPESLVVESTQTQFIRTIRPPHVVAGNPYIDKIVAGAKAEMATAEKPYPKNTSTINSFQELGGSDGSRTVGEEMLGWLWLYANPASPLKGDPEVLTRLLRRAHAYVDAIDVHGAMSLASNGVKGDVNAPEAGKGIFDDFAIAPASCALREFAQLYPGLLLPSQKNVWDRAMGIAGQVMMGKAKDRLGQYANIDLALSFELLNFGLYLHNQEYLDKSKFLSEVQENNLYPDGAFAYLGHQNESNNYHDTDMRYLVGDYEINQSPRLLEMIRKTEWYGPVTSGKLSEFWTVPSWKDTWNASASPNGGEAVASLTHNPYVAWMAQKALTQEAGNKSWFTNYQRIPFYDPELKPLPLPDNYTVIDRNINGPRAWYGRFNYAATLRPIPETEPGLATIMGAQMTDSEGMIGQVLMGAYPRVRLKKETLSADGKFQRNAYAWLTSGLKSALVMGRTFSAVAGSYTMHQYGSSQKGKDVDWQGRQIWLGLPDRVIGYLELSALKEGAQAFDVEGVLRLGTGGTVNGKPTKIEMIEKNVYRYGDLIITLFNHNFSAVQTPEVPFRLPKFPNTEIRLVDEKGANDPQALSSYPANTRLGFLVEIRSSLASKSAVVTPLAGNTTLQGFRVNLDGKQFLVMANMEPSEVVAEVPTDLPKSPGSFHLSGSPLSKEPPDHPKLPPGQLGVIAYSESAEEHLAPWTTYQEMVSKP